MKKYGKSKAELDAEASLEVRKINKTIIDYGITEEQKLHLINLLALELEDNNALKILTGAIHDIKNNVTNEDVNDIILKPL